MNKEEIREGLNVILHGDRYTLREHVGQRIIVDDVFKYLKANGLVRKVDRELPDNKTMRAELEGEQHKGEINWYYKAQLDMHRAGYAAVEELVKE